MRLAFAKGISLIFNPLLVIVFLPFVIVYKSTHDVVIAFHWLLYTLFFLAALTLCVFIGVRKKRFTDMDVSKREQRPLLFVLCAIFGFVYLVGLTIFHAPFVLLFVTWGIMVGIFLVSLVNKRIKASLHVATITALTLTIAVGYGGYFYLLLFIIPLIAWSRIVTKRHTLAESIVGGIVGIGLSTSMYSVYLATKVLLHK